MKLRYRLETVRAERLKLEVKCAACDPRPILLRRRSLCQGLEAVAGAVASASGEIAAAVATVIAARHPGTGAGATVAGRLHEGRLVVPAAAHPTAALLAAVDLAAGPVQGGKMSHQCARGDAADFHILCEGSGRPLRQVRSRQNRFLLRSHGSPRQSPRAQSLQMSGFRVGLQKVLVSSTKRMAAPEWSLP